MEYMVSKAPAVRSYATTIPDCFKITRTVTAIMLGPGTYVKLKTVTYLKEGYPLVKEDAYQLPEKLFNTKISWEPLLSVRATKRKLKIAEIPGDEPARIGGERKLKILKWGAAYYFQFIRELWFWK